MEDQVIALGKTFAPIRRVPLEFEYRAGLETHDAERSGSDRAVAQGITDVSCPFRNN